jgi:hypothetical protein
VPLTLALGLLAANLLHPTSQIAAGVAQCVFQATIAAPMFWGWKAVDSAAQLRRLLIVAFVFNTAGAALGVLQVYFPKQFMPPEFSSLGSRLNDMYLESLTYEGIGGERIVRPPGLSDQARWRRDGWCPHRGPRRRAEHCRSQQSCQSPDAGSCRGRARRDLPDPGAIPSADVGRPRWL